MDRYEYALQPFDLNEIEEIGAGIRLPREVRAKIARRLALRKAAARVQRGFRLPPTTYKIKIREMKTRKGVTYILATMMIKMAGVGDLVLRARVSVNAIARLLKATYEGRIAGLDPSQVEDICGGFFDFIKKGAKAVWNGAKNIAKKVARSKVIRGAAKIFRSPIVQAVANVIPGGAAVANIARNVDNAIRVTDELDKARRGITSSQRKIDGLMQMAKDPRTPAGKKAAKLLMAANSMVVRPPIQVQRSKFARPAPARAVPAIRLGPAPIRRAPIVRRPAVPARAAMPAEMRLPAGQRWIRLAIAV